MRFCPYSTDVCGPKFSTVTEFDTKSYTRCNYAPGYICNYRIDTSNLDPVGRLRLDVGGFTPSNAMNVLFYQSRYEGSDTYEYQTFKLYKDQSQTISLYPLTSYMYLLVEPTKTTCATIVIEGLNGPLGWIIALIVMAVCIPALVCLLLIMACCGCACFAGTACANCFRS